MKTLFLGNCLDIMKSIETQSVDMILCDLPYGTTKCSWDIIIPFDMLWKEYKRITKPNSSIILFGQEPFSSYLRCSNLEMYRYDLYWVKEKLTNIMQVKRRHGKTVETISVFYKEQCTFNPQMVKHEGKLVTNKPKGSIGSLLDSSKKLVIPYKDTGYRYPTQILQFRRENNRTLFHPTQKPVELLKNLILTFSNENDVVLDNCMGSGSTGVACIQNNRKFIGIELSEKYFTAANQRINEAEGYFKNFIL